MISISSGNSLGLQVLEALGLDPKRVTSVEISMEANQAATVTVRRHIDDGEARKVADCLSRYEVRPIDNTEQIKASLRAAAASRPISET